MPTAQLTRDTDASASSDILRADRRSVRDTKRSLTSTEDQNAASAASAKQNVASAQLALEDAQRTYDTAIAPADAATLAADQAAVAQRAAVARRRPGARRWRDHLAPADGAHHQRRPRRWAPRAPSGDAIQMQAGPMQVTAVLHGVRPDGTRGGPAGHGHGERHRRRPDRDALVDRPGRVHPPGRPRSSRTTRPSPSTDAPDTIRTGMSASVSVTTASQTGAIAVPIAALVGRNGNYAVRDPRQQRRRAADAGRGRPRHRHHGGRHQRPRRWHHRHHGHRQRPAGEQRHAALRRASAAWVVSAAGGGFPAGGFGDRRRRGTNP